MESAQSEVRYIINTTVRDIGARTDRVYESGIGSNAIFKEVYRGWYALFDGSHELLYLGTEEPRLKKGDKVKISIERIVDAKSIQPSEQ